MATSGPLAARRTATALDLKSLLRAAQRDAGSVEWPPALVQQLTNAIVEGEYKRDTTYTIKNQAALSLTVQLVKYLPENVQPDVWSELVSMVGKNNHNLYAASRLRLIGPLLKYFRNAPDQYTKENVLRIMERLGAFNISTREVKELLLFLRIDRDYLERPDLVMLLRAVRNMTVTDGPASFFDFSDNSTGLALPTLLFPRSGFSFAAWVRVGRMPPEVMPVSPLVTGAPPPAPVHQPHLYSFCNAQGQGFVAYFENAQGELHLILETRGPQGKHDRFEAPFAVDPTWWRHITITHTWHRLMTSSVAVYINGRLVASGKLKYPSIPEPLDQCNLAAFTARHPTRCFYGQIGAAYLFSEPLAPAVVQALHGLGPSYDNAFQPQQEDSTSWPKLLQDGRLPSKLVFCYSARACQQQTCPDSAPNGAEYRLPTVAGTAMLRPGSTAIRTSSFKDVIRAVGGIRTIYPLLAQLGPSSTAAQDSGTDAAATALLNTKILIGVVEIVTGMCAGSLENQRDLLSHKGFLLLGYLVERATAASITIDVAIAFKKMAQALLSSLDAELNRVERPQLLASLYTSIFFNWNIWSRAPAPVQRELLSDLAMQAAERAGFVDFRKTIGIQALLDLLADHFWFDTTPATGTTPGASAVGASPSSPSLPAAMPMSGASSTSASSTHGHSHLHRRSSARAPRLSEAAGTDAVDVAPTARLQLSNDDVRELRAYVMVLFRQLLAASKEVPMTSDEVRQIVLYASSIIGDDNQLVDFLPLLVSLLLEQPAAVTEAFYHADGVKVFGSVVSSKHDLVRIYYLKLLATISRKLGPNRRLLLDDLASGGYAQITQALSRSVVTKPTYDALYELLTGTVRKEFHGEDDFKSLDGSERILHPKILEAILETLSSHVTLRDPAGHTSVILFLRDLKALLAQSSDNRDVLLSLDNWQELLLGFLQVPRQETAALESLQSEAMRGSASRLMPATSASSVLHATYSDGDPDAAPTQAPSQTSSLKPLPSYADALTLPTSLKSHGRPPVDLAQPLPKGWSVRVDRTSGEPVFLDHVHRRTTWVDPRRQVVGILPEKGRDGQLVATVYNIFSLVYDDLMRSRDATPLWERCLGLLVALDPKSELMYTQPDRIRKRLYSLLLSPWLLSQLAGYLRDLQANNRTREQLARGRESVQIMQNALQALFGAAVDLLGLPRDVDHVDGEDTPPPASSFVPTMLFTPDDIPLLRTLLEVADFFIVLGNLKDLPFAGTLPTDPDGLLIDLQLQLMFALLDCKTAQEHSQIVDGRDIERLRTLLRRRASPSAAATAASAAAAASTSSPPTPAPGQANPDASVDEDLTPAVLRRTHTVLYVLTRILLAASADELTTDVDVPGPEPSTSASVQSIGNRPDMPSAVAQGFSAVAATLVSVLPIGNNDGAASAPASAPAPAPSAGPIAVVTYLRYFLLERLPFLAFSTVSGVFPLHADTETLRWLKEVSPAELVAYLASTAWQRYLDIAAQPAIQETIARLTTIPPLPTDVALMAMPLRKEAKLELIGAYESGVKAALYYLHDAEDQRRVRLSEADALNRATAVSALRMLRRLQEDPQGAWTGSFPRPGEHDDARTIEGMAYVPGNDIVYWRLDATEDAQRRRRRLKRNYKGSQHAEAVLHVDQPEPTTSPTEASSVDLALTRSVAVRLSVHEATEQAATAPAPDGEDAAAVVPAAAAPAAAATPAAPQARRETSAPPPASDLEFTDADLLNAAPADGQDETDVVLVNVPCELVTLWYCIVGELAVLANPPRLRFIGDLYKGDARKVAPKHRIRFWPIDTIVTAHERRYLLADSAMEIFLKDRTTKLFNFPSTEGPHSSRQARSKVIKFVRVRQNSINPLSLLGQTLSNTVMGTTMRQWAKKSQLTLLWQTHQISNFEYLMQLNTLAGRSYNDLSQWPVFPWILSNYKSATLDLSDPTNYRDLSKPIGALNPDRFKFFKTRYDNWDDDDIPKFLYGTHYSNLGAVLFFLVRMEPFTSLLLKLQSGKFDHPGRTFFSIPQAWEGVMRSTSDLKELIPEFFYLPEFLENSNSFDFGEIDGTKINDVVLPAWASTPEEFVAIHRAALESDYVSQNLHQWIDLIFGFKQRGKDAEAADNVFYYLTYEGTCDVETITDPLLKQALIDQVANFGQTPTQLFKTPHPKRHATPALMPAVPATSAPSPAVAPAASTPATAAVPSVVVPATVLGGLTAFASVDRYGTGHALATDKPLVPRIQWPTEYLRTELSTYPILSGMPLCFLAAAAGKVVTVANDGVLGTHRWTARRVLDVRAPVTKSAQGLPMTVELDGTVTGIADARRRLPWPLDEATTPGPSLFALSPDGKLLVSGGHWDCTVKVTNVDTGRWVQSKHVDAAVTSVALAPDGSLVVVGCRTGVVLLWEASARSGRISDAPPTALIGHDFPVTGVAASPELDLVASISQAGLVLHSIARAKFVRFLQRPGGAAPHLLVISPDGYLLVAYPTQTIVCYSVNGKRLWETETRVPIYCMTLSADNRYLVVGGTAKTVMVYRVTSRGAQLVQTVGGREANVRSVVVVESEQATYAIAGLSTGYLAVYALDTQ